jgi:hypothetical protein
VLPIRGRPREKSIGDTPICKNLAHLFGHPDSDHPKPHSPAGFNAELEKLHLEILRLFPGDKKGNMTQKAMVNIIAGRRNPSIVAIIKTCTAYKSLYGIEIDPYDLFVDKSKWLSLAEIKSKWLNLAEFSPIKRKIIENLPQTKNKQILKGILALTETNIPEEKNKANSYFEGSLHSVE